jgi:orotate phosphoribosyltransferase
LRGFFVDDIESALVSHLRQNALRTDGPFRLASGAESAWYLDARQTTFDGPGARVVAAAVNAVLDATVTAVGGMTMGADPIAVATAALSDRPLRAFSVRKAEKGHGTGGRLVGPVGAGDRVAAIEDTTTTGGSVSEAVAVLQREGIEVVQAVTLVDRSDGAAALRLAELGVPLVSLATPADLGVA